MEAKVNSKYKEGTPQSNYFQWEECDVVCVSADETLAEVIQLMKENQIGDVVVTEDRNGNRAPIGMITDRDVALCLDKQSDFKSIKAGDLISGSVVTASLNDDPFKLIEVMKREGVSRLPLVNESGKMVSLITARNLLEILTKGLFDLTQISEQQRERESTSHQRH